MDRNIVVISSKIVDRVALRKESVDRNREQFKYVVQCRVALRKESVDRNCVEFSSGAKADRSLSARRAWIEMHVRGYSQRTYWCRSPQGERG